MPGRPGLALSPAERARIEPRTPRERLAVELLGLITSGAVADGAHLPGIKALAAEHGVSVSTVHRAFELLREWGVVEGAPGERPRVRVAAGRPAGPVHAAEPAASAGAASSVRHWSATLRGPGGARYDPRVVKGDIADPDSFRDHLLGIARMEDPDRTDSGDSWIGLYELELVPVGEDPPPPAIRLRW